MRIFSKIYDRVMGWASHRHAQFYLAGLSFTEASFFPIPPDVMLAPMSLSHPERAWWYAFLATMSSTIGGLLGYAIGMFFWVSVKPWVISIGYLPAYEHAQLWFHQYGFLALVIAGFTPIPYKLFTIAAGSMSMALAPFVAASLIGRGLRFFLVATLMKFGGAKMENLLRQYVDVIGWVSLALVVVAIYFYH